MRTVLIGWTNGFRTAQDQDFRLRCPKTVYKAAEQGHKEAQYSLGNCYRNDIGVEQDDAEEAVKWYRKAADQGYTV
eukprot:COSAG01_NODE_24212_length_786_cov_1.713246_1_plen_75_part_01